jgi:F0F1-type ATP synthase membrane subunit b/b'
LYKGIQDAEDRLNEAQKRLSEAEKQLNQANLVIGEIKNETIATKKIILDADVLQARKDLTIRFERALATFRSKESQIFIEIKQQIISLVLKRTLARVQEAFGPKERAAATLINETINKLEGDLL